MTTPGPRIPSRNNLGELKNIRRRENPGRATGTRQRTNMRGRRPEQSGKYA